MACSLPHTDSEVEALVQSLIYEDKGRQDVLLNLPFQFEDSCACQSLLPVYSLDVKSFWVSSDVSDVGLPSEKVMASGKNGDDGDLLLFRGWASVRLVGELSLLVWNVQVIGFPVTGELSVRCWNVWETFLKYYPAYEK
ncbi:hypothetical protein Tco_0335270 [Tanacetum coccineum]|uniref:Uncharacterized protein n=1 Tax=Tanacetum coccineum TaxID=301880 RepID=A0ABQ5E950_9ASTR